MERKKNYTLGIFMILIGGVILLNKFDIALQELLFVAIGIALLAGYYSKRNSGYLIAGLIILAIGATSFIEENQALSADVSSLIFMVGLGIVFLILYFVKNIRGFVYPGCILPAIGIYSFLDDMYGGDRSWFFLALGISFFLIYLIDKRKRHSTWTIIPGTILIVLSGLFYLTSKKIITDNFWKLLSYAWPAIIIIIGIKILYNNIRNR